MFARVIRLLGSITLIAGLGLLGTATAGIMDKLSDGSPVALTGEVVHATTHTCTLDCGDGQILVEMDDWDAVSDGRAI